MSLPFLGLVYHQLATYSRRYYRVGMWSVLLALVATIGALSPEVTFLWASKQCGMNDHVKIPLDLPGMSLCLPSNIVKESSFDIFIPLIFAPILVAFSGLVVSSLGLRY